MYKSVIINGLFCYAITETVLTTTQTLTPVINISNDADFELYELRSVIRAAAALDNSVIMQMSLSSGDLFQSVGINIVSFATVSDATRYMSGYPLRLPVCSRIPANSQINVQLTNNIGGTLSVQVQLWGKKIDRQMINE